MCFVLVHSQSNLYRFAKYRDVREAVQQYTGVVAACLLLAFEELSRSQDLDIKVIFYLESKVCVTVLNEFVVVTYKQFIKLQIHFLYFLLYWHLCCLFSKRYSRDLGCCLQWAVLLPAWKRCCQIRTIPLNTVCMISRSANGIFHRFHSLSISFVFL